MVMAQRDSVVRTPKQGGEEKHSAFIFKKLGFPRSLWQTKRTFQPPMNWYYAVGQQQQGPVTEEQLHALVKDGVVTGDTKVWREGMADWQPYSVVSGVPEAAAPPPVAMAGAAASPSADILMSPVNQAPPEDYEVSIGHCLSRAWAVFKEHAGSIIGACALVFIVMVVANVIPFLGVLLALFVNGPLIGGLYWFFLKKVRGQETTVGDAFAGFGPSFANLMLAQIVSGILSSLSIMPGIAMLVVAGISGAAAGRGNATAMTVGLVVVGGLLTFLGALVTIYLSVSWALTMPLIIDKRMEFWPAMSLSRSQVGKHFFRVLWFFIVTGIISAIGALALGVGLLLTVPLAFTMITYLYHDLFYGSAAARRE